MLGFFAIVFFMGGLMFAAGEPIDPSISPLVNLIGLIPALFGLFLGYIEERLKKAKRYELLKRLGKL